MPKSHRGLNRSPTPLASHSWPVPWFLLPPRLRGSPSPSHLGSFLKCNQRSLLCLSNAQPLGGPLHYLGLRPAPILPHPHQLIPPLPRSCEGQQVQPCEPVSTGQRLLPALPEGLRFSPTARPTSPSLRAEPEWQSHPLAHRTAEPLRSEHLSLSASLSFPSTPTAPRFPQPCPQDQGQITVSRLPAG